MKNIEDKIINRLFARFQAFYLQKWTSNFQGENGENLYKIVFAEWKERLRGLTNDEIKKGLENLPPVWPPTPSQFVELCGRGKLHRIAAYNYFDRSKALTQKLTDEQKKAASDKIASLCYTLRS